VVDLRAKAILLLIGLLLLCALLVIYFAAIEGEKNTVDIRTSTPDEKSEGVNQGVKQ
jgi:hypothetical protein